jgi:DNA helicase-2/ATP-dependent DNA helicase PcrA
MSDGTFQCPEVTDEDILWASRLLDLPENAFTGSDGKDPRGTVLKSMMPMDVAACPGSGKTTLLVAKLAILANKWTHRTRGICVVSHTNAARHEIESRLGNTAPGRCLLAYPHFVGTIQRFVDEFLALPCLRSHGYPVKMVDTDVSLRRRWYALQHRTRSGLERYRHGLRALLITTSSFDLKELGWGRGNLGTSTPTYTEMQDVCRRSISEGHHCYEEMFVWAQDLLDKVPGVVQALRERFPLLFIDEAQDNSEAQAAILHRIFMSGDEAVARQRFGDPNQAIYDFFGGTGAATDAFPSGEVAKEDLLNSHRFGQTIADLADPLGLKPYGLKGHGPMKPLASGSPDARHTIFLFDDKGIGETLDAYAELLIETFSQQELNEGTFTAIGQVHRPEKDDHKPRHVGHYWPTYDPCLTSADPTPETLHGYIVAGQAKAGATGEAHLAVDKIAEGIFRLAGMVAGGSRLLRRIHRHRHIMSLLEGHADVRRQYEDLIMTFAEKRETVTEDTWNGRWSQVARQVAETISGGPLSSAEASDFLRWQESGIQGTSTGSASKSVDNVYRHVKGGRTVAIRIGSIHSAKGETHTATLVLETYWYDHNLESLLAWLDGSKSGESSAGDRQESRLKVHYVAMTRPTHLLCLAMKKSTVDTNSGLAQKLTARGWVIQDLAGL